MNNSKVAKIHPELDEARNMFNLNIAKQLGIDKFPKIKSDKILANAIKQDLMNFNIVVPNRKKSKMEAFDIHWKS